MNWLLAALAGSVLVDGAVETVASRRVSIPRALSFVRFGLILSSSLERPAAR